MVCREIGKLDRLHTTQQAAHLPGRLPKQADSKQFGYEIRSEAGGGNQIWYPSDNNISSHELLAPIEVAKEEIDWMP